LPDGSGSSKAPLASVKVLSSGWPETSMVISFSGSPVWASTILPRTPLKLFG
jgi:hypothetical protein